MVSIPFLSSALTSASLLAAGLLTAQSTGPAAVTPDYDPLLQAPGLACVPGDKAQRLMGYDQKLAAAKTEVRPFPTNVPAGAEAAFSAPPLWDNLGRLHFAVSTTDPLAQRYFDQGLKLAYAFNHAEAARAFRQAQILDPHCALCHWGEALVLEPNINAPMEPSTNATALAALNAAYAEAMGKVAARYPRDADITLLYAQALMNLAPWDYREAAGARPKGRTAEIITGLEKVLQRQPDHPGAIHFYIHMVEASTDPERALPSRGNSAA